MAAKGNLRAVRDGEAAQPPTILAAAEREDRLGELRAMRRRIARTLDDPKCPPRDLAALTRRQVEIGREIEALVIAEEQEAGRAGVVSDEDFDASAL